VTAVDTLLNVARSQIGTVENPDGSNPYGREYGFDRVAWCAEFVWWAFQHAGLGGLVPKSAYTPTFFGWFEQHGQAPNDGPNPGDVIFYDWELGGFVTPGREGAIDHVGIVEARLPDGRVQTIEGNTTPPTGSGNQGSGGGVWRRARAMSCVAGWGRPAYPGSTPAVTVPVFDPNTLADLSKGMTSPHVALFQKASNDAPWSPELPILPVTGFYGEQTTAVVASAQAQRGVTGPDADGTVIGPRTKAAFAAYGLRW
jgi:hypothetical protein